MSNYDDCYREITSASLADLLDGEYGASPAAAAARLLEEIKAMSAGQVITACHHSGRLSDRTRKAAEWLGIVIDARADELADQAFIAACEVEPSRGLRSAEG